MRELLIVLEPSVLIQIFMGEKKNAKPPPPYKKIQHSRRGRMRPFSLSLSYKYLAQNSIKLSVTTRSLPSHHQLTNWSKCKAFNKNKKFLKKEREREREKINISLTSMQKVLCGDPLVHNIILCHFCVLGHYNLHVPNVSLQYIPKPTNSLRLLL